MASPPAQFLIPDTSICDGELTTLSALSLFKSYLWSTGATSREIQVGSPGDYWLQVVDSVGCSAKEQINVQRKDNCALALYFPSAFTPNRDGLNDQFKGTAFGHLTRFHLTVYNRWGNIVFETSDITKGWDGTVGGIEQSSSSFVWLSEYQFDNQPLRSMKGVINLIR